jgi:hypothetical protein
MDYGEYYSDEKRKEELDNLCQDEHLRLARGTINALCIMAVIGLFIYIAFF